MIITPTIGRKVWFRLNGSYPSTPVVAFNMEQPMDATIVYVHGDHMVNLRVTDHMGTSHAIQSVQLVQEGDVKPGSMYCEWMPYQTALAKKNSEPGPISPWPVFDNPKPHPAVPGVWPGHYFGDWPVITCGASESTSTPLSGTGQLSTRMDLQ